MYNGFFLLLQPFWVECIGGKGFTLFDEIKIIYK